MGRSPLLSLFGAYVRHDAPFAPKPLIVDVYAMKDLAALLRGELVASGCVRAEDLAGSADAEARLMLRASRLECRIAFVDEGGARHEVVLAAGPGQRLARALTELSGLVFGPAGGVIGSARLRVNWRIRR
jgi:hypothetical protein